MVIADREEFGPAARLHRFKSEHEAVRIGQRHTLALRRKQTIEYPIVTYSDFIAHSL
jgi:hypothetical protein